MTNLEDHGDTEVSTLAEATAELMRDGNLRVPCSRYGHDTASCIPVAWRLAELIADANGEPITLTDLEHCMSLVVNNHDDVASILTEHGATPEDYEMAAYECSICGDAHSEDDHGEPLVMRDTGRDTVTGNVSTFLADALALTSDKPGAPFVVCNIALQRIDAEWSRYTENQRDEYASEVLDDIDDVLSDAGFLSVTDADQGTWCVYGPAINRLLSDAPADLPANR